MIGTKKTDLENIFQVGFLLYFSDDVRVDRVRVRGQVLH